MSDPKSKKYFCESCPLHKLAESRPNSILGRLWKWHISWCPGWKAYQSRKSKQQ